MLYVSTMYGMLPIKLPMSAHSNPRGVAELRDLLPDHLRSAVDQANEPIIITDADLEKPGPRILYANHAVERITGYDQNELIGRTPRIFQGPRTDRKLLGKLKETLRDGRNFRGETVNYRKDGSDYAVRLSIAPVRNSSGETTHFIAVHHEIGAELQSRQELERQRIALDLTDDAVLLRQIDGPVLFSNQAFERIFGFQPGSGDDPWPPDVPALRDADAALREHGEWTGEFALPRTDGTEVAVSASWRCGQGDNPDRRTVVEVYCDLTEKREIERRLILNQRMENLAALAGGIAHDLNNILAPIGLSAEMLARSETDPQKAHLLSTIKRSMLRSRGIISQLHAFSHGIEEQRFPFSLNHIIREVRDLIQETFPRNLRLKTNLERELWTIHGNPTQIQQVLMNLAVNANEAMPEGGEIAFSTENAELSNADAEALGLKDAGSFVRLSVADTGPGIPPELHQKIFEPFVSTKSTTAKLGLGLPSALGIAVSHGGCINLESETGQGSRFTILLPATGTSEPEAETEEPHAGESGSGHVLVVDDEETITDLVEQALGNAGFQVDTANSGSEAIEKFSRAEVPYDLVLTDLVMPEIDGLVLIRTLRRLQPGLRCIIMSGYRTTEVDSRLEAVQDIGQIVKPFTMKTLLGAVGEQMEAADGP